MVDCLHLGLMRVDVRCHRKGISLGPIRHLVHAAAIGSGRYGFPFTNLEPDETREPSFFRPKVPEGKTRYLLTRQKEANEKGYVGYDTIWESFQKESEYQTPKRP